MPRTRAPAAVTLVILGVFVLARLLTLTHQDPRGHHFCAKHHVLEDDGAAPQSHIEGTSAVRPARGTVPQHHACCLSTLDLAWLVAAPAVPSFAAPRAPVLRCPPDQLLVPTVAILAISPKHGPPAPGV